MRKRRSKAYIAIIVITIIMGLICFYPIWYTLIISFSDRASVEGGNVWLYPKNVTLMSYKKILNDRTFFKAFYVSVKRVVVGCSLNMVLLILLSYPLCQPSSKFPEGKFYKWFLIANMFFTGGLIPSYMIIKQYHLFDSFWALVLPSAVPLWNMILLINFFKNVPIELEEAAAIDGANPWLILWKVFIPLSKPSLACLLLFQFVGHWNAYFDGLIYINDITKQPLQTYIYQISTKIEFTNMTSKQILDALKMSDKTLNAAKVIVAMVPVLCFYPFVQKYFTVGMTLGAVKG